MLRLITDFDGPIMDVSERYYRVYQFCLENIRNPEQSVQELTKAEFWQLKRSRVPEREIGVKSGLDATQAQEFAQLRRKIVHTDTYFKYDRLIPGAVETLVKIQQAGIDLAVMTMRRVRELDYALTKYDLAKFFPENRRYCLENDYVKTSDVEDKPLLMQRAVKELPPVSETWMVGDTEADIAAAKQYNIKMIAVESGIRDRTQLEIYQPDLIVKDLSTAVKLILESQPLEIS
ncbi:HAD family hydrolase [Nodularia harveyana UHCC-0300]|uniref:HAD family hydrolase n=1 Tax=Nodularia harveyana UHCC-0300 TaxID=2974287 RepID=A0ABU5UD24_9CYAN|nr:HAD family hydrolase [Nodularia harveyana]MEA5581432.1 HAD family hydrolase [Nodularia harveyana UHCC-0300]